MTAFPALVLRSLVLIAGYVASGWVGLQVPFLGAHITLIWLPAGIAVAALLRWGFSLAPAIYFAAFLVNLSVDSTWHLAAGIAVGNTLGPVLVALTLRRTDFQQNFSTQRDVHLFIAAAVPGTLVSALFGSANLWIARLLEGPAASSAVLTWWMGDLVGVLLTAPLLLTLTRASLREARAPNLEKGLWLLVAGFALWFGFIREYQQANWTVPLAFPTLAVLAWAAIRFGVTATLLATFTTSTVVAWQTAHGRGSFYVGDAKLSLVVLWSFMLIALLIALLISTLRAERQRAEDSLRESEEKLRGLYELSPLGIVLTGMDGRFLQFNEEFQRLTGYTEAELRALGYWELTPGKYETDELQQLESLRQRQRYGPYVKEYVRKDGSTVPVQLNGVLVTDRNGNHYVWSIVEDISARKLHEDELYRALNAAQEANLAKSTFLATMSHEIRTPLNGIVGMAQLLQDPELAPGERRRFVDILLKSAKTLQTLLGDILDLSSIDAGKLRLHSSQFHPAAVVEEVAMLFFPVAHAKHLTLEAAWQGPPGRSYSTDGVRVRQMLANLISNAIKFTAQGAVRVRAREIGSAPGYVTLEFEVIDSGIGIAQEQISRLFQPFSQVDGSNTREYGGAGLGLSIVRRLARMMGGDAGVESEPGDGSRFWFRINVEPWVEAPADVGPRSTVPASHGEGAPLVLLAEDVLVNRMVIDAMLVRLGCRSYVVNNGEAVMEALLSGMRPDLILMDIHMSVGGGMQTTRRIRDWEEQERRQRIPIVGLGADALADTRSQSLVAGMDDFIAKPVDFEELARVLKRWLPARAGTAA